MSAPLGSRLASALRLGRARRPDDRPNVRPATGLVLYEFEACPFCRLVREAVTDLDLEVTVRPCPRGGTRFRPEAERVGGKAQFPLLVDPTLEKPLYESRDIVAHLYNAYGERPPPGRGLAVPSSQLASLARLGGGGTAHASRAAPAPLRFMGTEGSPSARMVRELLCELELEYVRIPMGDEDPERVWLHDASTNEQHEGWEAIVAYLKATYASP